MKTLLLIPFFLLGGQNIFAQKLTMTGKVFTYNKLFFKYKGSLQYNFLSDSIVEVTTKVHDLKSIEEYTYHINFDTIFISKDEYIFKKRRLVSGKDKIILKQIRSK